MWLEINLWKIGLRMLMVERTGAAFSSSPHFEDVIKLLRWARHSVSLFHDIWKLVLEGSLPHLAEDETEAQRVQVTRLTSGSPSSVESNQLELIILLGSICRSTYMSLLPFSPPPPAPSHHHHASNSGGLQE